ncbi:hypothetical protein BJX99DRAFT_268818 [Aspergillus californicus]
MSNLSTKAVLCALGLLGIWGTHGHTRADGSTALLLEGLESPTYLLPGTQSALRKSFTGFQAFDDIIRMLVLFWWETLDGSHPTTSTIGLYFLGQALPCILIVYLNALRGEKPSLVKPTLWLLLFQVGSIGATSFIWALVYIIGSPTVQCNISFDALRHSSTISDQVYVWLLLPALALGYALPAFLMSIPSSSSADTPALVSNMFQQYAIAVWNMYPLVVLVLVYVLRPVLSTLVPSRATAVKKSPSSKTDAHPTGRRGKLTALRTTNITALIFSTAMHISIVGISLSTILFPTIFRPAYINHLSPASIFLPPLASGSQALTPGDGVRGFLLWDQVASYATILVVVLGEFREVVRAVKVQGQGGGGGTWASLLSSWTGIVGVVGVSLVLGPGSACLVVSWMRDEILFGDEEKGGEN